MTTLTMREEEEKINHTLQSVALGVELKVVLSQVLAPFGMRTLQTFS